MTSPLQVLDQMIAVARTEIAPPGRSASIKDVSGDIHGRLGESLPSDLTSPRRPITKKHWDSLATVLSMHRVHHLRERAGQLVFAEREIAHLRAQFEPYRLGLSVRKIRYCSQHEAMLRLERHYGHPIRLDNPDEIAENLMFDHQSPMALRARGNGTDTFPILAAFLVLSNSRQWNSMKFRNEADYAILGVSNFCMSQYDGKDELLNTLLPIVNRNVSDPSFTVYRDFNWPRYHRPNVGVEFSQLKFAMENPIGKSSSYYGGKILDSVTYYAAAKCAAAMGLIHTKKMEADSAIKVRPK